MIANRPLVWAAVAYAAGIAASARWGIQPIGVVLAIGALIAAAAGTRSGWANRARSVLLLGLFAALGAVMAAAHGSGVRHDPLSLRAWQSPQTDVVVEGRIRRPRIFHPPEPEARDAGWLRFELLVDTVIRNGVPVPTEGRATVAWSGADQPLFSDTRVRIRGTLDPVLGPVNPGIDSYEDYLRSRGVHSALDARGSDAVTVASPARWWWIPHWTSRMRQAQADMFRRVLPNDVQPFANTIWLGDRSGLDDNLYTRHAAAGTAHILAVSGIHMAILYGTLAFLLPMRHRRRTRAVVQIVLLLSFALVAGARLSALRAALMFTVYLLADILDRERDAPSALSLAGLVFLAIEPMLLFNTGFLLSFLSVASLLLFSPRDTDEFSWSRQGIRGTLRGACTVQLLPLPVALRTFHVMPLLSPLTNLVVIPLLGIAVWLCVITSFTALLSEAVATLFGHALSPVVWTIETVTTAAAALPFGHVYVTTPTALAVLFYVGGLAVAAKGAETWRKRVLLAAPLFLAAFVFWRPFHEEPLVAFLDVGHGDATVIRAPGGEVTVIDAGIQFRDYDVGRSIVAPFLWAHGITRIDTLIGTHPDMDHVGGFANLLRHFDVGEVWIWPEPTDDEKNLIFFDEAARLGVPVLRAPAPRTVPATGMVMDLIYPTAAQAQGQDDNNQSLVMQLTWNGATALLTGDIEKSAEAVVQQLVTPVSLLKVPHHGSNTSSTPAFVDTAQPLAAIVSTGNWRGRTPVHPEVAAVYRERGIPMWRTDRHGGLTLVPRDGAFVIESARAAKGYLPPDLAGPVAKTIE